MENKDLKVKIKISLKNIKEISENCGLGYLNCNKNSWKDGSDKRRRLTSMPDSYLKNCSNEIDKVLDLYKTSIVDQLNSRSTVDRILGLDRYSLNREERTEVILTVIDKLIEMLNTKKIEIQVELTRRASMLR